MALSIGICTNFLGGDRYSLQTERYPEISRVFDYVELPAMTVTALSDPEFDALRAELEKVGLRCPVMTNLFPADIPLLSPSLDAEALKAYLDVLLPRCRALGCSELVLGSGKARSLRPEQDAEEGYTRLAELLNRKVLPTASEYGIRIILEPLNPLICNFILTLGEGAELCRRCDGQLTLLADSLHLMHQENIAGEILKYRGQITHVHLSEPGRKAPETNASPALTAFLRALKTAKYDGSVSFECRFPDGESMQQGRAVLQTLWDKL